jgi:hypothetical protein
MKNIKTLIIISFVFLFVGNSFSQIISEDAKRKVTIGADIFTDIWQGKPADMELRTINQGVNIFATYNFQLGEGGNSVFAVGLGIDNHNMYSNTRIENVNADTVVFAPITEDYNRSKINLTYGSVPLEFKFKFSNGIKLGAGFKIRYLISSKDKYVGNLDAEGGRISIKRKTISATEDYSYGFTLRAGYKSFSLFGYYQISNIFQASRGPQMYPISVGLTITPF